MRIVDVHMANKNQDRTVELATLTVSLGLLHVLRRFRIQPATHIAEFTLFYALLHAATALLQFKRFASLPSLPEGDTADDSREQWQIDRLEESMRTLACSVLICWLIWCGFVVGEASAAYMMGTKNASSSACISVFFRYISLLDRWRPLTGVAGFASLSFRFRFFLTLEYFSRLIR